jgi:hypothetical protein
MSDYYSLDHDSSKGATVKFSRNGFSLPPGSSTILLLSFTPPSGIDGSRLPVYSGQIGITGGPVPIKITYMGAATKMRDIKMISTRKTVFDTASPALLQGVYATAALSGQRFRFSATTRTRDFPSVMFNLLTGTRSMVMDLVAADAKLGFQPTYTRRNLTDEGEVQGELYSGPEREGPVESGTSKISTNSTNEPHFVRAGADLDFTPIANSRRSPHRTLRTPRAVSPNTDKLNAALKSWCQYNKFQGKGCIAPSTAKINTFAQVPVKGNIFAWRDVSRK